MGTDSDSSSDDSDHYDHHHLDQEEEEHNSDASNDVDSESESESGSGSGSNSRSNSEEASSDSDDSSSDDEVSSPEILTRNNRGIQLLASMLDLEASESHSSEDDDDNNSLAEHIYEYPNSRQVRRNDHQSFPKFALLPYELRQRIWEMFCPDMTAKGRVYEFYMRPKSFNHPDRLYDVWECHMLEQQTAPARAMSAVCRESREHVLRRFPDVLRFRNGRNMIRWDRENDIAILNVSSSGLRGMADTLPHPVPGFSDQIRNMAIDDVFFHNLGQAITDLPQLQRLSYAQIFRTLCPHIKRVFRLVQDDECLAPFLRWCAAGDSHHYLVRTEEEQPGVGENAEYMYSWPSTKTFELVPENLRMELKDGNENYILQPLIRFSWERGLLRFEKLVKKYDNPNSALSDTESDNEEEHEDEEPDEYESSGIDDSEIIEDEEGGSESEDDLVVVADDSDQEEEASSNEDEGPTLAGHLSGTHDGPIEITDDSDDESLSGNAKLHRYPGPSDAARCSSIEPSDSSTMDEESSSSPRAGPSRSAGSGRKRALESDSEEDEEHDGPPRKVARISNESRRRARTTIVLSDDDDEGDESNSRMEYESNAAQRANAEDPVVISDDGEDEDEEAMARRRLKRKAMQWSRVVPDEEEDDDDEDEMPMTKKIRSRRGIRPPASDTDDGKDEDDDDKESDSRTSGSDDSSGNEDEDDKAPARPLTLAEKLELHRRNNPIPDSDDGSGDDDDGSVSGDDYDARNYADFQDDEEGNEIEDEDEEDKDEGLIMDMADEEVNYDEEDEY